MRSGGGVLCVATLQLIVGICLLGIYEGYKAHYYGTSPDDAAREQLFIKSVGQTPMDFLFYLSIVNNVFSVFGLAGVLNAQRELVIAFFAYNAVIMVVDFHYFWDLYTDISIRFSGEPKGLTPYEQSMCAFVFFNFLLSVCAIFFAVKALEEIKNKNKEEFTRMAVLSDNLQYETDT
mmetsp:Transcript_4602/g.11428  ORF Transcript_4602/g.11428 Transcript_4602/m.11428 type:complete len:177 (+) Transcript_4602:198-728(+)|eukprot:jgi/Tetstr1/436956/TSEL_025728.t1